MEKRVISFQRVSTSKQDLTRQMTQAKDFCKMNGYKLVGSIAGKISGNTTTNDNALRQELLALTNDKCDIVIISELSRITREEQTYYRIISYIDTLKSNGIDVIFLDDERTIYKHDEPFTLVQLITLLCRAEGAANELNKIKTRNWEGKESKARMYAYMVVGSKVPFGFHKYPNPDYELGRTPKSLIEIDDEQAAAVRKCFEMVINGHSCMECATYLNNMGYLHDSGKKWHDTEVNRMIKSPLYKGQRTILKTTHEITPIVDAETWRLANDCIKKNRCNIAIEKHYNPLKGILFCDCGLSMMISSAHDKPTFKCLYRYYYKRHVNTIYKECKSCQIGYDWCLYIVKEIIKATKSMDYSVRQTRMTIDELESENKKIKKVLSQAVKEDREIYKQLQNLIGELKNATSDLLKDLISKEIKELEKQEKENDNKRQKLNKMLFDNEDKIKELQETTAAADNIDDMDIYQLSELFHKAIRKMVWNGEKNARRGTLTIEFTNNIQWELQNVHTFMNKLDKAVLQMMIESKLSFDEWQGYENKKITLNLETRKKNK